MSVSDYYKNGNARMFRVLCRPAAIRKSRNIPVRFGTEPITLAVYLLAQLHISTSIYSLLYFLSVDIVKDYYAPINSSLDTV